MEQQAPGHQAMSDIDSGPPSYDNIPFANKAFHEDTESRWDKQCPEDWQTMKRGNFNIIFGSDPQSDSRHSMDWEALLRVKAQNLPRLMRQGFHWSTANVQKGEGFFLFGNDEIQAVDEYASNWSNARVYSLRDLAEPPQWIARLMVFSQDVLTLSDFRLENLSVDQIRAAAAFNWDDRYIYNYNLKTGVKFNAIYDDMPLDGWWPWPKNQDAQTTDRKQ